MTDPTPTDDLLAEFRAAYEADDNHWWRTESGLHQVVFDEACDRLDAAEAEVAALQDQRDTASGIIRRFAHGWQALPDEGIWYLESDISDTDLGSDEPMTDIERAVVAAVDRPPTGTSDTGDDDV
jgi:hypothetical protein